MRSYIGNQSGSILSAGYDYLVVTFQSRTTFKFMSACSFHWCSDNACQMQPSLHLQNLWSCLLTSTGSAKFNSCFQMGIKLGCSCFGHQNTRAQSWERVHGFITPLSDTAAICSLKDQFPFYKEFVIFYWFFFLFSPTLVQHPKIGMC